MASESQLQEQIATYLRLQYPDVLFHSDFGSGVKLTMGQAMAQKRQNGGRRAWPDMFIAQPKALVGNELEKWNMFDSGARRDGERFRFACGLFLEFKREGVKLVKQNGDWASEHIAEQAKMLVQLRRRGYCAEFAVGFEQAKKIINAYLGDR